jgi:aminoglycoside phosphotransferase family enzyme/predicted kinase
MAMKSKTTPAFQDLTRALSDPGFYPHQPSSVRVIHTHASLVVLAKPFAYKIKKPVDFGFLNYATLAQRKHFLERELMLNQALAPGVYMEVKPVFWNEGKLTWQGTDPEDWILVMRCLSEDGFMHRRMLRGSIGKPEMERILALLHDYYGSTEAQSSQRGTLQYLRQAMRINFRMTESCVGDLLDRPVHQALKRYVRRGLLQWKDIFKDRMKDRWRWCHGDLHLEHVHLTPKKIRIYDCIEFNDGLRWIDMANDLAFLAMDLDYHGHPELARYLTRRASEMLEDDTLPVVMDFYKSYRAMVRAKVASLQVQPTVHRAEADPEQRLRATRYFQLALEYALSGKKAVVFVVMGKVASGKSTVAALLARWLGCEHLNSDCIRKEMAGVPLHERPNPAQRRRLYSRTMTRRVYQAMQQKAWTMVKDGFPVIMDATFSDSRQRASFQRMSTEKGISVRWIELYCSDLTARARLRKRATAEKQVSDAGWDQYPSLNAAYVAPESSEGFALARVTSTSRTDLTLQRVLNALMEMQLGLTPK